MEIDLIKEAPSPNVTLNIPDAFQNASFVSESYNCKVIDGVYIFDIPFNKERAKQVERINNMFDAAFEAYQHAMYPVDVTGFKNPNGRIGSQRFCTMSSHLAKFFTEVILKSNMLDFHDGFEFKQVSKYFRAMKYQNGGEHFPHYDSDFQINSRLKTKMSLVCYGDNCDTGKIAFVKSGLDDGKKDWDRQATKDEIFLTVEPCVGRIVVFDHSICHTVLPYTENKQRRVLRGDLIFVS
jgi:hypothetical protein